MTTFNKETVTETVKTTGKNLVETVKKLIHEGNIRKITIKDKEGKVLAVFPLTFGVVGAVIAPVIAIVAGIAVFVTEASVEVEKVADADSKKPAKKETK